MDVLVCYDVNTEKKTGQKRLRRVAKICQNYGQRAQKSVFECQISEVYYEQLIHRLTEIINEDEDSLRIYRLMEPRSRFTKTFGRQTILESEKGFVL